MKIKKGDKVQITTGKDAGKSGKIIDINLQTRRVIIDGLNLYKKHFEITNTFRAITFDSDIRWGSNLAGLLT